MDSQWTIAIFAGLTFLAIVGQVCIYRQMHLANIQTQRAYLDIAPKVADQTLVFEGTTVTIPLTITNTGITPAHILGGKFFINSKPDPQPTPNAFPMGACYLPTKGVLQCQPFFKGDAVAQIQQAVIPLWVMAYVDYADQFGGQHRIGFGRKWHPPYLAFDDTTVAMNYERPLSRTEKKHYKS